MLAYLFELIMVAFSSILRTAVTTDFLFIVIVFLVIYIGFLHYQLSKKNFFIESLFEKLVQSRDKFSKQEMNSMMDTIRDSNISSQYTTRDKLLNPETMDFIFSDDSNVKLFMHYTKEKVVANKILDEGFEFAYSFYKTAEMVIKDKLDLSYKHNRHKQYGKYVIVLGISKKIFDLYSKEIDKFKSTNILVEQILTLKPPYLNDNSEEIYTLPPQYVKGYLNYSTGEIIENPEYNPGFNSKRFLENISKFQNLFE